MDDASVCGLRHGRGDQRALQVPPGARANRSFRGIRLPHADGLRLRSPPESGRSWSVRGRDFLAGRHGNPVRRYPARPGVRVHDHQRSGGDPVLLLRGCGRAAGRSRRTPARDRPKRHPQGVPSPARVGVSAGTGASPDRGHVRVVQRALAQVQPHLDLGLPYPRGGRHRRAGTRLHPAQRLRVHRAGNRTGPGCGRFCASALVLLRRTQRLLRGSGEVPGRAAHLGASRCGRCTARSDPQSVAACARTPRRRG